jgi:hypothetical protein
LTPFVGCSRPASERISIFQGVARLTAAAGAGSPFPLRIRGIVGRDAMGGASPSSDQSHALQQKSSWYYRIYFHAMEIVS